MKKNLKKYSFFIFIAILILLLIVFFNIMLKKLQAKHFANQTYTIYQNNMEPVFKVEKIILCSSANAVDESLEKNMQELNIFQYTDIAIYIENGEELTKKNTIKKMYIDNIILDGNSEIGTKSLIYKNIQNFGLKEDIKQINNIKDINFNVISTNKENEMANYNEPTFYTDCSNPITLEYLNYNIKTNYKLDENNAVSFDGSILNSADIPISDLECKIRFRINIINNENEKYTCYINFKNPLSDIYSGTTMKAKETNRKSIYFL